MADPIREEFEIKRRLDDLYTALEVCSAELFAQCGDQVRAMKYVEQARKALAAEQCARAALAAAAAPSAQTSGQAAPSDEEILDLAREHDAIQRSPEGCEYPGIVLEFARALLSRYGHASADIEEMVRMLEAGEWAEHAGVSPLGKRLEAVITKLVGQAPAASAEMKNAVTVNQLERLFESENVDKHQPGYHWRKGWNAAIRRCMDISYPMYATPVAAQAPQHITSATAARDEFPMLYDSLDALDERAAEQPERIGTKRHLSSLRASIQAVVQKLSLARARIADLESAAQAPAANGDALREAVKTAYGYLWHVNNEPGTPNQYAPERAAYEARKVLREHLTKDERGDGINVVRAAMQRTTGSEK